MKTKITMDQIFTQISIMAETNFGILIPPDLLRMLVAFTAAQVLFFAYVALSIWRSILEPPKKEKNDRQKPQ